MPCGKKKKSRRLAILAVLLSMALPVGAELGYTAVDVTAAAQTVAVNAPSMLLINDGTNEIYVRVYWVGETVSDATTSSARLDADEFGVFLLVFLSTFPVAIPFMVLAEAQPAMRVSNATAVVLLFMTGYAFGRITGRQPWLVGCGMVVLGLLLVGLTMALGG